eukprot:243914-Chlamydomonas_euryale.AAC.1
MASWLGCTTAPRKSSMLGCRSRAMSATSDLNSRSVLTERPWSRKRLIATSVPRQLPLYTSP